MLSSIVRFFDDAEGLEKSLRLCQYLSQTASVILTASSSAAAGPWGQAHEQFALARRYFRLLKWYESFSVAYHQFHREQAPLRRMLEVSKWSFLGLYFFFEMFTITNAMRVTDYSWGPAMQHEANKYWLYAIVSSIFVSLHQLFLTRAIAGQAPGTEPKGVHDEKTSPEIQAEHTENVASLKIYRQLAIDCADVIIPLEGVGWVPMDETYVGLAGTVSTLIAGQELWWGVQSKFASFEP